MLNQSCPYAYVFETLKLSGMDINHQADNLPHPFVIEPPLTDQTEFQAGDEFDIGLVLFGKSVSFLPYFVFTFDQMGKMGLGRGKGKFELISGFALNDLVTGEKIQIYDGQSQVLNGNFRTWRFNDLFPLQKTINNSSLKIKLLTPTRITQRNQLIKQLPFELFLRTLLRRISLLGRIHCDSVWELPYREIIDQAVQQVRLVSSETKWHDWERYSNRQRQRMSMGGIVGSLTYEGNLVPYLSLILLGQFTHIGKNTTFGLGQYVVGG